MLAIPNKSILVYRTRRFFSRVLFLFLVLFFVLCVYPRALQLPLTFVFAHFFFGITATQTLIARNAAMAVHADHREIRRIMIGVVAVDVMDLHMLVRNVADAAGVTVRN